MDFYSDNALKRHLEETGGGAEGLVSTQKAWFDFRKMRNVASRAYEDKVAQKVYEAAPLPLKEATYLFQQLSLRNV